MSDSGHENRKYSLEFLILRIMIPTGHYLYWASAFCKMEDAAAWLYRMTVFRSLTGPILTSQTKSKRYFLFTHCMI